MPKTPMVRTSQKLDSVFLPKGKLTFFNAVEKTYLKMFLSIWVVVYDEGDLSISERAVFSNFIKGLRSVVVFPVFDVFGLKALFGAGTNQEANQNQTKGGVLLSSGYG